jgi:hypothetical protein
LTIPSKNGGLKADVYFTIIPEWVLLADISAQAVRLYGLIRRYADADNQAWPSRTTLANRLRVSTKTIDRSLAELSSIGAVVVEHRFDASGDMTTNLYRLATVQGVATPMSLPSDTVDATGGDKDVPTGGDTGVPQNESQFELEPIELEGPIFDANRLANLLADLIEANGSKRPKVTKAWLTSIDRMIRLDGRTADQVERAMRWAQSNDFWASNIMSPDALRKQFDRMRLQAQRTRQSTGMAAVAEYLDTVGA